MGHKIHPIGFRLGVVYTWQSRWFANKQQYAQFVVEDTLLRRELIKKLRGAGITKVEIERSINKINVILHVVRPGMVIGRGGSGMEDIKKYIQTLITKLRKGKPGKNQNGVKLDIRVEQVKEPYLNAHFVASQIAEQVAKRLPHKRVVSFAVEKVMGSGAKGVKVMLSGRIGGAEISRRETFKKGSIPLSTIREHIDYEHIPSLTKSGYIGVKVWICTES